MVVTLGSVGSLTAADTPLTTSASSAARALRSRLLPPPRSFDPAVIPYVGSPGGWGADTVEPLYLGAVDGSGLVKVADQGVAQAWVAGDGRILMSRATDGVEARPLVVRDPDGTVRPLAPAMESLVLSADGDTAYGFADTGERGAPLLRIPLDGSPITETGLRAHLGYDVFVSPDERSLAVTMGSDAAAHAAVVFDGGQQRDIGPVTPVGFDARSRLIRAGRWFRTLDPDGGLGKRLLGRLPFHYGYTAPDGRYLAADRGDDRQFVVLDLKEGHRTDLQLPGPGDWTLRRPGIDRYVVLQHSRGGGAVDGVVIHDLVEGWTGYLPWRGYETTVTGSPAPSPSPSTSPITQPTPGCTIPDPHQPAPPVDFDASAIPWIGDQWGYHDQGAIYWGRSVWVGALDGSGQRAIISPALTAAHPMADGSVVVARYTEDAGDLVVIGTDGSERLLAARIDDSMIGIDQAGSSVYAWRQGPDAHRTIGDV